MKESIVKAVETIKKSKYIVAFTGAGISVESGIAPFRGENGIWNKYEEKLFDINYFNAHKQEAWEMLCDGFYEGMSKAKPNDAHRVLAEMEKRGMLKSIITQNIDNLHTKAGSKTVYELHGNASKLICQKDAQEYDISDFDLKSAPKCKKCGALLKPNFVFFGEQLPEFDFEKSIEDSQKCDLMIIIGSTGVVYPAAGIPPSSKNHGAKIIEINPTTSTFTDSITDIFIPMKAGEAMREIEKLLIKGE
ncbi:MAG: NAD-dependent deacylase [Elusimicrobiota bacterium]|jgi:NAD-dependent deacetylase|nr:NAD-dependent deacylase [Elusimicrobiota bacterium]